MTIGNLCVIFAGRIYILWQRKRISKNKRRLNRLHFATSSWGEKRRNPYAFTRNGIAMLSSVLRLETAIGVNIRIMRAFTAIPQIVNQSIQMVKRIVNIEHHQQKTDGKIELILDRIEEISPEQIFPTGCVWDAWTYVSDFVRSAQSRIIHLSHRNHDRFLIIDDKVHFLVASLTDMGVGLCAITEITTTPENILTLLK